MTLGSAGTGIEPTAFFREVVWFQIAQVTLECLGTSFQGADRGDPTATIFEVGVENSGDERCVRREWCPLPGYELG